MIQLRYGVGLRKNTSDAWLVWLSSTSTNHCSHGSNRSSSTRSSQPMLLYRMSSWAGDGGRPARTSSIPTSDSRERNAL